MADDVQDISDYRDAIESMLLSGEQLEAAFFAAPEIRQDLSYPHVVGITSARLIVCYRSLNRGRFDHWRFRSILYPHIVELELSRSEQFHRDRIDALSGVTIHFSGQNNGTSKFEALRYRDSAIAREVHDRILAHMLAV